MDEKIWFDIQPTTDTEHPAILLFSKVKEGTTATFVPIFEYPMTSTEINKLIRILGTIS